MHWANTQMFVFCCTGTLLLWPPNCATTDSGIKIRGMIIHQTPVRSRVRLFLIHKRRPTAVITLLCCCSQLPVPYKSCFTAACVCVCAGKSVGVLFANFETRPS